MSYLCIRPRQRSFDPSGNVVLFSIEDHVAQLLLCSCRNRGSGRKLKPKLSMTSLSVANVGLGNEPFSDWPACYVRSQI